MKTVIVRALAWGTVPDTIKVLGITFRKPITNADYNKFLSEVPKAKEEAIESIKAMLARGGFIYDPTLIKWKVQRTLYSGELWCFLCFTDNDNEGRRKFLSYIYKTGILNTEDAEIIKGYY